MTAEGAPRAAAGDRSASSRTARPRCQLAAASTPPEKASASAASVLAPGSNSSISPAATATTPMYPVCSHTLHTTTARSMSLRGSGLGSMVQLSLSIGCAPRDTVQVGPREADVAQVAFAHRPEIMERSRSHPPLLEPAIQPLRRYAHASGRSQHDGGYPEQRRRRTVLCVVRHHHFDLLGAAVKSIGRARQEDFTERSFLFRLFHAPSERVESGASGFILGGVDRLGPIT